MTDRLLKKRDIAAIFQTSAERASSILSQHGVHGFTLGTGRGLGFRWLESAVMSVVHTLAAEHAVVPKEKPKPRARKPKASVDVSLYNMSTKSILELTKTHVVQ